MKGSNFYAESALHLMFSISMYSKRTFQFVITRRKKIPYFVYRSRTCTQNIRLLLKQQLATFVKSTSVKGSKSKIRCTYSSSPLVTVQGSWSLVSKLSIDTNVTPLELNKTPNHLVKATKSLEYEVWERYRAEWTLITASFGDNQIVVCISASRGWGV